MAKAYLSIPALWLEVVEALHPRAILSITVTSSKCNPFPAEVRFKRDFNDPSLCAVAAAALWFVLQGPTLEVDDPFLNVKEGSFPTRGLTVSEVLNPLRSFLLAPNTQSPADSARTIPMVCVTAAPLRPSWVVPPRPKRKLAGVLSPSMCQQRSRLKLW